MAKHRSFLLAVALASALLVLHGTQTIAAAAEAESVRAEVGKPLQAAQDLIGRGRYSDALGQIRKADKIGGKTPYETYLIARLRGAAAAGAGDPGTAAESFEAVLKSGRVTADEKAALTRATGEAYYQAKHFDRAVEWLDRAIQLGSGDASTRTLLAQAHFLKGDYAAASRVLDAHLSLDRKAGRTPAETQLQLLANCALKRGDQAGYVIALEQLVAYYPKPDYWADLIGRVGAKPDFADRLDLDIVRLKAAVGILRNPDEYMEGAQLALQAGLPGEASQILDRGFAAKVLGMGPDAARHERLRALVAKEVAADRAELAQAAREAATAPEGTALVATGLDYVGYGDAAKGVSLIEQGLQKGGLKHPDDARLRLGTAYLAAGDKGRASAAFRSVQGRDGSADLARLWLALTRES